MVAVIVDDERFVRRGIIENIPWHSLGIETVIEARNGMDCLKKAEEFQPDILIADIRMPKLNGIDLGKEIASRYPKCKMIIISAYSEKEYLKSAISLNVVAYVEKPIVISELEEAVIPKLTLQPLVENALYHGIKLKRGPGRIYVVGQAQGEDILLQVTDDGAGMSPERLEELTKALDQGERVGFGLSTVHERVRLFFGPPYGLSISSQQGVGTTISVRVPLRREASP